MHQHIRWFMWHQMTVNLSLIYNHVVCAQILPGQWNHRKDLYMNLCSPILNFERRWCLSVCCVIIMYAKEIKGLGAEISLVWFSGESVERKYSWLKFVTWNLYCASSGQSGHFIRFWYWIPVWSVLECVYVLVQTGLTHSNRIRYGVFGKLLQICN
jgi:hypothetical protein